MLSGLFCMSLRTGAHLRLGHKEMANVKDSACRVGRAQSGEESPFYARLACRRIKNAPNALLSHLITREICKNTREVQHHSPAARTSRNSFVFLKNSLCLYRSTMYFYIQKQLLVSELT